MYKNKIDLDFTIHEKDTTPPKLKVFSSSRVVYDSPVTIQGETEPDAIDTVNNKQFPVDPDGTFSATIDLQKGDNKIEVTATDKAGN